ncbi:Vps62-related protein [Burkholderia sp. YIM B11467]
MSDIYLESRAISYFETPPVTDSGSRASGDISFWIPYEIPAGWSMLGMSATPNYNSPPSLTQNVYKPSEPNGLISPTGFAQVWTCVGHDQPSNLGIYMPIAPDGYIALGCVAVTNFNEPPGSSSFPALKCVRQDLCEQVTLSSDANLVWTDAGSHAPIDVCVWMLPTAKTCVATARGNGYPSSIVVWDLKNPDKSA